MPAGTSCRVGQEDPPRLPLADGSQMMFQTHRECPVTSPPPLTLIYFIEESRNKNIARKVKCPAFCPKTYVRTGHLGSGPRVGANRVGYQESDNTPGFLSAREARFFGEFLFIS